MVITERREKILELLEQDRYVNLRTLMDKLNVSEATIRRDLEYLANKGAVIRTHGGAFFSTSKSQAQEPMLDIKVRLMVAEKQKIGRAAAKLVSPGDTIIVDSGSTTWHIVENLAAKEPLTVVSNDLQILARLVEFPGITAIDPGGIIRPELKILLGPDTVKMLECLHVNWVFLGANAVDPKHGLTSPIIEEASIKQAMIRAGQNVVLVADHTKFGKALFTRVCDLRDIHLVITDAGISPSTANEIRALGVKLMIVE